jgi:hypothetical protein
MLFPAARGHFRASGDDLGPDRGTTGQCRRTAGRALSMLALLRNRAGCHDKPAYRRRPEQAGPGLNVTCAFAKLRKREIETLTATSTESNMQGKRHRRVCI